MALGLVGIASHLSISVTFKRSYSDDDETAVTDDSRKNTEISLIKAIKLRNGYYIF